MSSRFRTEYRPLTIMETDLIIQIKTKAEELDNLYQLATATPAQPTTEEREKARLAALSRTSLEESVMWGVKAITG